MRIIAKYENGSKSYGLHIPNISDNDVAFLFLHTDISKIIGLEQQNHENKMTDSIDSVGYELRHFLNLLRKGNVQCLEMLHNTIWLEKTKEFDLIQKNKEKFLDSKTIYNCFKGYSYSERNLIFGRAHLGRIGEKRKNAILEYGYSYRNASHCFRLLRTAIIFFNENYFPINIVEKDKVYGFLVKDIKINPQNHKPENLEKQLIELEKELDESYKNRKITYRYNNEVANQICYDLYFDILEKHKSTPKEIYLRNCYGFFMNEENIC